jgi:hypothetical protein
MNMKRIPLPAGLFRNFGFREAGRISGAALLLLAASFAWAAGKPERVVKPTNAPLEEVLRQFDGDREFKITGVESLVLSGYGPEAGGDMPEGEADPPRPYTLYSELYIDNDFIFYGYVIMLFGGETFPGFDYKHYNFVIELPEDGAKKYAVNDTIGRDELRRLLEANAHRAEVTVADPQKYITYLDMIKKIEGEGAYPDMSDEAIEEAAKIDKDYIHNTLDGDTIRESKSSLSNPDELLLFMIGMLLTKGLE